MTLKPFWGQQSGEMFCFLVVVVAGGCPGGPEDGDGSSDVGELFYGLDELRHDSEHPPGFVNGKSIDEILFFFHQTKYRD